jgi:CubicO group peptidase (beta-lactamase class C family)
VTPAVRASTIRLTATAAIVALLVPAAPASAEAQHAPTLRDGIPQQVHLLPEHIASIRAEVDAGLAPSPTYPRYPGAVVLAARDGVIVEHSAFGHALRYASSTGTELPPQEWIPMRRDTIHDVASLSKLFTAVAAMQQVESGRLDLDAPAARYIPQFAAGGKQDVTVRHLMTHTAGLPAGLALDPYPTVEQRLAAIYAVPLRYQPGTQYLYSDLSFIVVGKIVERVGGAPLDVLVRRGIIEPLGLTGTMHNPPAELRPMIAPTEWQESGRGLIWGEVHDRTSWLLGGTAGHAGLFSNAYDIAVFGQTMLNGGRYGHAQIVRPESVSAMLTNWNAHLGRGAERGLGFQLATYSYMGAMRTPGTYGHTGFTGTSLVIDPATRSMLVLLSNRVHPTRAWSDLGQLRQSVATNLARAVPVRPASGRFAWFSGLGNLLDARLTLPLPELPDTAGLSFDYWWDSEAGFDVATVELSGDGGQTWAPLPLRLRAGEDVLDSDGTVSGYQGRRWFSATAELPARTTHLRWRYTTDVSYGGRGVYVDSVVVRDDRQVLFDERRPADAAHWQPDGFARSAS